MKTVSFRPAIVYKGELIKSYLLSPGQHGIMYLTRKRSRQRTMYSILIFNFFKCLKFFKSSNLILASTFGDFSNCPVCRWLQNAFELSIAKLVNM